jgi:hypothetical protein
LDRDVHRAVQFDAELHLEAPLRTQFESGLVGEPEQDQTAAWGLPGSWVLYSGSIAVLFLLLLLLVRFWIVSGHWRLRRKRPLPQIPESVLLAVQALLGDSRSVGSFVALMDAEPIRRKEIVRSCLLFLQEVPDAHREEIRAFLEDEDNLRALISILRKNLVPVQQSKVV